jgi:hypothetical protein
MAEMTSNIEMAHRVHEHGHKGGSPPSWRAERVEILEAVALAAVAVLTAWSGYQAARWESRSAASYARAARITVMAQSQQMLAGQDRLYDITTFNSWVDAKARGDEKLLATFRRRFRPEYTTAFLALLDLHLPAGIVAGVSASTRIFRRFKTLRSLEDAHATSRIWRELDKGGQISGSGRREL